MSQLEAPSMDVLREHCKALRMPTAVQIVEEALDTARREDWPLETFLQHLLTQELAGRRQRRIERRINRLLVRDEIEGCELSGPDVEEGKEERPADTPAPPPPPDSARRRPPRRYRRAL